MFSASGRTNWREVPWRRDRSVEDLVSSALLRWLSRGGDVRSTSFEHSEDYRSAIIHGRDYSLTARQAHMIQILHVAYEKNLPDVAIARILEELETEKSRWQDTWRTNPKARKALIRSGNRKGTLRLNL